MDPPDFPNMAVSQQKLLENVRQAQTMGLVEGIREATAGHEVDAEAQPLSPDLLRDLEYTVRSRGHVQRDEVLYFLHPEQMYILRSSPEMVEHTSIEQAESLYEGAQSFHGMPMLVDSHLPRAVVYLVDPQAISVGGTVIYPNRVGRLTGLMHPSEYHE